MSLAQALPYFLSADNAARNAAEQVFVAARQDASSFLAELQSLSVSMPDSSLRQLAAVMLRRNLQKEFWESARPDVRESIKAKLIASLSTEPQANVKKAISEAIAQLACVAGAAGLSISVCCVV